MIKAAQRMEEPGLEATGQAPCRCVPAPVRQGRGRRARPSTHLHVDRSLSARPSRACSVGKRRSCAACSYHCHDPRRRCRVRRTISGSSRRDFAVEVGASTLPPADDRGRPRTGAPALVGSDRPDRDFQPLGRPGPKTFTPRCCRPAAPPTRPSASRSPAAISSCSRRTAPRANCRRSASTTISRPKGSLPRSRRAPRAGATDTPGRELYSRRAKTIIRVGAAGAPPAADDAARRHDAGDRPRPRSDSGRLRHDPAGDDPLRRAPLAGAFVKLNNLDFDARPVATAVSDAHGAASFKVPFKGLWQMNVVWTTTDQGARRRFRYRLRQPHLRLEPRHGRR